MKRFSLLCVVLACSDYRPDPASRQQEDTPDAGDPSGGQGGAPSNAGSAGLAGSAGSGGFAGAAGSAGAPEGGAAGEEGSAGDAGAADEGVEAGASGASGGTMGVGGSSQNGGADAGGAPGASGEASGASGEAGAGAHDGGNTSGGAGAGGSSGFAGMSGIGGGGSGGSGGNGGCEDDPRVGELCSRAGEPPCLLGTYVCAQGELDCDVSGSSVAALLGSRCTVGTGICARDGVWVCDAGYNVECSATPGPSQATEVCDRNFEDEDCDGSANEGCACTPGLSPDLPCGSDTGTCEAGVMRCQGSTYSVCEQETRPSVEVCDDKDNDCNGLEDDVAGAGALCDVGVGECRRVGIQRCDARTGNIACDAVEGPASLEVCNSRDDDCNGTTDDIVAAACSAGVGACLRSGLTTCKNGVLRCSAEVAAPTNETCNSIDDNCDGLVDYTIVNGAPVSACQCSMLPVAAQSARRDFGETAAGPSTCSVAPGGAHEMSFEYGACGTPLPWAQCIFESVRLGRFDADHSGRGALEVHFCNSEWLYVGINLYYGQYPQRKRLKLLSDVEKQFGLEPTCHVRYFTPEDAACEFGTSCVDDDPVPLYLTAEFCTQDMSTRTTISDLRIRYVEPTCICLDDQDCKDPAKRFCDLTATLPDPRCGGTGRCAGVCVAGL